MSTKMLINAVEPEECRIAVIEDGLLEGFHIETSIAEQIKGNIYKAVVERVEPRLQACFVNFGADKNGFLQASEVHPEYYQDAKLAKDSQGVPPIEKILKKNQELLVQVTKEMPGRKGAHLTTYVSLAGRYIVLTPGRTVNGVSRKIEDEKERQRLKAVMGQMKLPENVGYIVRTVAAGQNKKELSRDLNRLVRMWKSIYSRVQQSPALSLIHKEQDLYLRTLRDYFTAEVSEILVDEKETFAMIREYMKIISPRDRRKVKPYKDERPIFDRYRIEEQLERVYSGKVPLKSGGSLVFDTTEALNSIDVNSGRGMMGKGVETTAYKTNLEAAAEIARQLRLRDMGGLIVIDFIDMKDRKHNREVEKILREELKKDRAKTDVSHISKFGLMELSRQRLRPSVESRSYQVCPHCQGRGVVKSVESAAVSVLRQIWKGVSKGKISQVNAALPLGVGHYLQNKRRKDLAELEARYGVSIVLTGDPSLPPGGATLDFVKQEQV